MTFYNPRKGKYHKQSRCDVLSSRNKLFVIERRQDTERSARNRKRMRKRTRYRGCQRYFYLFGYFFLCKLTEYLVVVEDNIKGKKG